MRLIKGYFNPDDFGLLSFVPLVKDFVGFSELHLYTLFVGLPAVLANFLRLTSMMLDFSFLPHSHKLIFSGKKFMVFTK